MQRQKQVFTRLDFYYVKIVTK